MRVDGWMLSVVKRWRGVRRFCDGLRLLSLQRRQTVEMGGGGGGVNVRQTGRCGSLVVHVFNLERRWTGPGKADFRLSF